MENAAMDPLPQPLRHHPVFDKIEPWRGIIEPGFAVDFLGIKTRRYFFSDNLLSVDSPSHIAPSLPPFDEEYLEWIDLLESIAAALDRYTILELGAGWGRWLVRAAVALHRMRRETSYTLVGVEAEPTHFEWLNIHLQDNEVDLTRCHLVNAAVAPEDGEVWFVTGHPSEWYGQAVVDSPRLVLADYPDAHVLKVRAVTLDSILRPLPLVDLADLDVQGAELDLLRAAAAQVDRKVRRLHIGTHKPEIEAGLRKLLAGLGWEKVYDFPMNSEQETSWGRIRFQDGVQSWINRKLF